MEFKSDLSQVKTALGNIDYSQLSQTFHDEIANALKYIQDAAKANLQGSGVKVSPAMTNGIVRQITTTNDAGRVMIRGNTKSDGQYVDLGDGVTDFKNLFFDGGTVPRYTGVHGSKKKRQGTMKVMSANGVKKGYRGSIKPTNFFQNAAQTALPQAEDILAKAIEENIVKKFNI